MIAAGTTKWIAALALTALAGGFGDRFIYYPVKHPLGDQRAAEKAGLPVVERALTSKDGTRLNAWWSKKDGAKETVLYLHGNGGNLTFFARALARMREKLGVNVYAVDWRGYGKSEGRPSEEGLYQDAEAAYDDARALSGEGTPVFVHGHSLGTGVSSELALRRGVPGVVLESPFTSMTDMVRRAMPVDALRKLVTERYDSIGKAPRIAAPVLVIHGTADRVIPVEMGRALFGALTGPKDLLVIEGAAHNDCFVVGEEAFYARIRAHMDRSRAAGAAVPF